MAGFASYQLVLSRHVTGGHEPLGWRPEVIYDLHLPPTDMDYRPRPASVITPLFGAAHIETGPTILADLTISLQSGVAMALASTATGRPAVLSGLARDRAMRAFMQAASERISTDGWRLEFHADTRSLHLQVVPTGTGFHAGSGMSRVGGATVSLQFTAVAVLDGPVGLIGSIRAAVGDAVAQIGVVAGALAYGLDRAAQIVAIPTSVSGLGSVLAAIRVVTTALQAVVNGTAALLDVPGDTLRAVRDEIEVACDAFVAAGDLAAAQTWHDLGTQSDAALAAIAAASATTTLLGQTTGGSATAFAVFQSAQLAAGNKGAAQYADPHLDEFPGGLSSDYVGWVPYVVQAGDTLFDIAAAKMGTTDLWVALAKVNGLAPVLTDLQVGTVIKIPVKYNALPWAATPAFATSAAFQAAMVEYLYLVGFAVAAAPGMDGAIDFVIDDDDPRDVRLVTGVEGVAQRYRHIGFRTDLGSNPSFPDFGVWLGVGRPDSPALRALTRLSATQLLSSDPRIVAVDVVRDEQTVDAVDVEFDVRTVDAALQLTAPAGF